jgi:hypothetical protein
MPVLPVLGKFRWEDSAQEFKASLGNMVRLSQKQTTVSGDRGVVQWYNACLSCGRPWVPSSPRGGWGWNQTTFVAFVHNAFLRYHIYLLSSEQTCPTQCWGLLSSCSIPLTPTYFTKHTLAFKNQKYFSLKIDSLLDYEGLILQELHH